MKKSIKQIAGIVTVAAGAILSCGSSWAADLPMRPEPTMPVAVAVAVAAPVPTYTWTGIYLGLNGGYGFGQATR